MIFSKYQPLFPRSTYFMSTVFVAFILLPSIAMGDSSSDFIPPTKGGEKILYVPAIDPESMLLRDKAQLTGAEKVLQLAEPFTVNATLNEFGHWEPLDEGRVVWRLFISAPGATDVNIGFADIFLPQGCNLYLTSLQESYQIGPYTQADNTVARQLWSPVLPGDYIMIEAEMPTEAAEEFELVIGQVNSGYRDLFRRGFPEDKQGACNIDVICPAAAGWRNEIRSVGRYTISGTSLCTGSLVMNQRADFRAFFLTAAHCLSTSGQAASVVVYWNYEAPTCGLLSGGSLSQYQSGAALRATYSSSDFTLLELNSVPDSSYNVYYAGWDRTGSGADAVAGIHHPRGAVKAICFENDPLMSTAYLSLTPDPGANHWRVVDWDSGTTEGGSSGSGLWYAASHRIIGQLHGGWAACGNDDSDFYGKLSVSWTGGGTSASRLSDWLDPDGTGLNGMDGGDAGGIEFCSQPGVLTIPITNSTGSYTVSWGASSTPDVTYVLEEATNSGFTVGLGTAYTGTSLSASLTGRTTNTYYYRVKAEKTDYIDSSWRIGPNRCTVCLGSNCISALYTAGDIPTDFNFQVLPGSSSCPGTLSVSIPVGAVITGVDVTYAMTGLNVGYMSEQRSQLRCVSNGGTSETTLYPGVGNTSGTYTYNRTGLTIANGVTGGGDIQFELHAGRTWGSENCNTTYNKVNNNSWMVTIYYFIPETCGQPGAFTIPLVNETGDYTVSWGVSSTPDVTYVLEEATNSGFTANLRTAYTGNSTSASITGRSTDTTYYYRVKATKVDYNDSEWRVGGNGCSVGTYRLVYSGKNPITALVGDRVEISVTLLNSVGLVEYQWYRVTADKSLDPLPWATDKTILFYPAALLDAGEYVCIAVDTVQGPTQSIGIRLRVFEGLPLSGIGILSLLAIAIAVTGLLSLRARRCLFNV
jgi:hypothetical protein